MFPFTALAAGLDPRRHPDHAIWSGLKIGLALGLLAVPVLLVLAPIHDPYTTGYPALWPGELWWYVSNGMLGDQIRLRLLLALGIGVIAGVVAGRHAWEETSPTEPFRPFSRSDPKIYRDEFARTTLLNRFAERAGPRNAPGLWLAPHLAIPRALETRGIMILGASGSGKSNLCRALVQSALDRGDRLILHCRKGDVTAAFRPGEVVLISPTHRDGWAWDMAGDIDGPAAATAFSQDVVPPSAQPFWSDTARLVMADVILLAMAEHRQDWDARTLLDALSASPLEIRARIERLDLSASPLLGPDGAVDVSKTVEGVMTTLLSGALKTLREMAYAWSGHEPARHLSVKRWLSPEWTGARILVVQTNPDFPVLSTSVCGGILKRVCAHITGPGFRGSELKVTMILDEFSKIGKIDNFSESLSVAREMGLTTVVALQSVWQLREIYGDGADTLSDLFQIKIYSMHTAGPGATDASERLGTRRIRGSEANRHPEAGDKRRYIPLAIDALPIFSPTQLQAEVGVMAGGTPRETIRALIHYAGNAYLLDWPPTRWLDQGEGYVAAAWTHTVPIRPEP